MTLMNKFFIDNLVFDAKGLIPAITQDWLDGAVLMMAWMNKESLKATIDTGEVHYWSRSRNELWRKGATSGYIQKLKGIRFDCDSDVILLTIEQIGSISCHKGERSCFYQITDKEFIEAKISKFPRMDVCSELYKTIEERHMSPDEGSYTNSLLKAGENRILKKIGEESTEFVMACKDNDSVSIANEAADLIFHLQVALRFHDVEWKEVLKVLDSRKGKRRKNNE